MSDSTNYSFCKECRKKCKDFDSEDDYTSDTSSEYYQDLTSSEVPIDLTSLTISEEPTVSESEDTSEVPIDLTSLTISEEPSISEDESESEDTSEVPIDLTSLTISEEPSISEDESESDSEEDMDSRKRKRGSVSSNNSDYTSDIDFNKLSLEDSNNDKVSQLSQLLSSIFVSQKEPSDDDIDILTSKLSRKLRVSPKKKRKEVSEYMDVEDIPIKQRLRKSIKKPTKSGFKIVSREKWSSKSD